MPSSLSALGRYRLAATLSRVTGLLRLGAIALLFRNDLARGDAFSTASNLPNVAVDLIGGAALIGLIFGLHRTVTHRHVSVVPAAAGIGIGLFILVAAFSRPLVSALHLSVDATVVSIFAGQIPAYFVLTAVNAEDQARGRFGASLLANAAGNVSSVVALVLLWGVQAPDVVLALALTVPLIASAALLALRLDRRAGLMGGVRAHTATAMVLLRAVPRLLATSAAPGIAYLAAVRADSHTGARLSFNLALAGIGSLAAVLVVPAVDVALQNPLPERVRSAVLSVTAAVAVLVAVGLLLATPLAALPGIPSQLSSDVLWSAVFFPAVAGLYAAQRSVIVHDLRVALFSTLLATAAGLTAQLLSGVGAVVAWGCCYAAAGLPAAISLGIKTRCHDSR